MPHLNKILLPVDFSESCAVATRHAAALARHFHSEVTLLHVNELPVLHALEGPLGFGLSVRDATLAEHITRRRRTLYWSSMERRAPRRWAPRLRSKGAGLLVIARSCGSGMMRRLGSDAYDIICHSPCPVVTV